MRACCVCFISAYFFHVHTGAAGRTTVYDTAPVDTDVAAGELITGDVSVVTRAVPYSLSPTTSHGQDADLHVVDHTPRFEISSHDYNNTVQDTTRSEVDGADLGEQNEEFSTFYINASQCSNGDVTHVSGTRGTIYGIQNDELFNASTLLCRWALSVPKELFISFTLQFLTVTCVDDVEIYVTEGRETDAWDFKFQCSIHVQRPTTLTVAESGTLYFKQKVNTAMSESLSTKFKIKFRTTKTNPKYTLPITWTSPSSGFITSPGYEDGVRVYYNNINASRLLVVPEGEVVIVSFSHLEIISGIGKCESCQLELYVIDKTGSVNLVRKICAFELIPASVYDKSLLLHFTVAFKFHCTFKMLFSFHPLLEAPMELGNGLFNCSAPHFSRIRQHVECNLERECSGGEDEHGGCDFSSLACNGLVASLDKCYLYVTGSPFKVSWHGAREECKVRGGDLAMMKTEQEWEAFLKLFQHGKRINNCFIGMRSYVSTMPSLYVNTYHWTDSTISYNVNVTNTIFPVFQSDVCAYYDPYHGVSLIDCQFRNYLSDIICQIPSPPLSSSVPQVVLLPELSNPSKVWTRVNPTFFRCPAGHMTFSFLSCDHESACGADKHEPLCTVGSQDPKHMGSDTVISMFMCTSDEIRIPYTLVCDFRQDCVDGSDEAFCSHRNLCPGFTCYNGQCISPQMQCNIVKNCWDGSDEKCDEHLRWVSGTEFRLHTPGIVNFDRSGNFVTSQFSSTERCPETHFRCSGSNCLPVYLLCNGVFDCPYHEDELDCQHYTCPEFYRCRASLVCLHVDHLCDGVKQCPQHDDELFCALGCPQGCQCLGLSYVCDRSFPADEFPDVRYLDAKDSGMTPNDLVKNSYLIWLSLASCHLETLPEMDFPNLRYLDLSKNNLVSVDVSSFLHLDNLKSLQLSQNPLESIISNPSNKTQQSLIHLDLSRTYMNTLDSKVFSSFTYIENINASFSRLSTISPQGFLFTPNLKSLDIRGNDVQEFPDNVFRILKHLENIKSDNFKLCCKDILPDMFNESSCVSPVDDVSSCSDLLRSDVYRFFLWIFGVLTAVGNASCFLFRLVTGKNNSIYSFNVFVTNLCISDFLMSLYLFAIGTADQIYRGKYLWNERKWKNSTTCQMAGFLSLLSSQVSAFTVCFITLDRLIVLRFPFSRFHFQKWSAVLSCGIAWGVGICLAGFPLLPSQLSWEFYDQNGVCVPLPISRKTFRGYRYSFGVMIVLHLILFVFVTIGQTFIYFSIQANSLTTDTTKRSQDMTIARRLTSVVVAYFLCWFPIGILSLLSSSGVRIPGDVNLIVVVFVLPLNSTLNPFLYTFNVMVEQQRKAEEVRLLKQLMKSQLVHLDSDVTVVKQIQ